MDMTACMCVHAVPMQRVPDLLELDKDACEPHIDAGD